MWMLEAQKWKFSGMNEELSHFPANLYHVTNRRLTHHSVNHQKSQDGGHTHCPVVPTQHRSQEEFSGLRVVAAWICTSVHFGSIITLASEISNNKKANIGNTWSVRCWSFLQQSPKKFHMPEIYRSFNLHSNEQHSSVSVISDRLILPMCFELKEEIK